MATSDLYKIGRLVNSDVFVDRVSAAMLLNAQTLVGGTASNSKNLAIATLLSPMRLEPSMTALVAADSVVLSQVTLDGTVANLEQLVDAEIKRVVAAKWTTVAAKYPNDPTPVAVPVP